ncbi:hypothetical protein [Abyssisolibacter fermentans]|uniref:hypothetical protein n=1 Tax=Abyssisolibacter fermentans TaxID=1766203 RepID=UPI00082DC2B9|nr:hypothetical protein [Abyssisolibacter fermentans]
MNIKRHIILIILAVILIIAIKYIKDKYEIKNTIAIDEKLHETVQDYLDNEIRQPRNGGKILCSYVIFGAKGNEIYLSVVIKEFYRIGNEIRDDQGLLTELVLIAEKTDNEVIITDYKMPPDGVDYGKTIKKWFTKEALENKNKFRDYEKLEETVYKRAKKYYENY